MLPSVGWTEIIVLMLVALVVIGPERLPDATRSLVRWLRQAREVLRDTQSKLESEIGDDFDLEQVKKPLQSLQQMRGMSPRTIITKHLLDGDASILDFGLEESPLAAKRSAGVDKSQHRQGAAQTTTSRSGTPAAAAGPAATSPAAPRPAAPPSQSTAGAGATAAATGGGSGTDEPASENAKSSAPAEGYGDIL